MPLQHTTRRLQLLRDASRSIANDPPKPSLRFIPTAWAKLLFLRDCGLSEVGGFAITGKDDLLLVEEVQLVQQNCTDVSVAFLDEAVADFFDRQVDRQLKPEQFARIWVHTHPGNCAMPSSLDEGTFERVFGRSDWALMFILAKGGQTYARLRFSIGPGGEMELPVSVDYSRPFAASDWSAWQQEYADNVRLVQPEPLPGRLAAWEDEFWPGGHCWDEASIVPDEPLMAPF